MQHPSSRRQFLGTALAGTALACASDLAWSQAADFPNRPIELIVPFGAGGGTDVLARVFADAAKKHLSQPLTVLNKPGASGGIGLGEVAAARPDGYKLAVVTGELAIIPSLGVVKFTPEDFAPIVRLNVDPLVLVVSAQAPWQSLEEFVAAVRKGKEPARFGNAGVGGLSHLAAAALGQKIGVNFTHVPFQGNAPAVVALLGGHIDAVTCSPAEAVTYLTSGKLRALGVFAEQRLKGPAFEAVRTIPEQGIDLSIATWRGIAAPKGLPADVMARLSEAALKTAAEPSVKEAMEKQNLGYAVANGEVFRKQIAADYALFKPLIEQLGIK